jgi:hypothetical protein
VIFLFIKDLKDFEKLILEFGNDFFWRNFFQTFLFYNKKIFNTNKSMIDFDNENELFRIENISELYEIGLAIINKSDKKKLGQYYTPKDVSKFMSEELLKIYSDELICDVSSGTGNLLIEFLSLMKPEKIINLIKNKKLNLFDIDHTASFVAKMKICYYFIEELEMFIKIDELIKDHKGNFLSNDINLPNNSIVISNPPYGKLDNKLEIWDSSTTKNTKDLYSIFIEKMVKQSKKGIIISPQSYLGGNKFNSLRKSLSGYGGSIFAFDNVPASIFNGRKKGIFNSNKANSVRAAIMLYQKDFDGFRVTPLIRFKNNEREYVFSNINRILGNKHYNGSKPWLKIQKNLENLVDVLSNEDRIFDCLDNLNEAYSINIPSTPRYFITGTSIKLNRSSFITIHPASDYHNKIIYLVLNSSISYLWWRIHDGGITITKKTLLSIPVLKLPESIVNDLYFEGISLEKENKVLKNNANKINENIKLPKYFRDKINLEIIKYLNLDSKLMNFLNSIHSNNFRDSLEFLL